MTLNFEKKGKKWERTERAGGIQHFRLHVQKRMFSRSERDSIWLSQASSHFCQLQLPDCIIWLKGEKKNTIHLPSSTLCCFRFNFLKKSWVAAADLRFLMTAKTADEMFHSFPLERRKLFNTLPHNNSIRDHQTRSKCLLVNNQWQ